MTPPGEISMVNRHGRVFRARPTQRNSGSGAEYLYNIATDAFQFRIILPDVGDSLIVQDVTRSELRWHMMTGDPVPIKEVL